VWANSFEDWGWAEPRPNRTAQARCGRPDARPRESAGKGGPGNGRVPGPAGVRYVSAASRRTIEDQREAEDKVILDGQGSTVTDAGARPEGAVGIGFLDVKEIGPPGRQRVV